MSDVFLSYARADEDRAEIFREILEAEGWDVWWDREIRLGESWNDALEAALASSKVIVVLWTESSVTRDFVMREASYAAKHEKLIGVRLEPCEVDRDLAQLEMAELDGWQCEPYHHEFQNLLKSLEARAPGGSTILRHRRLR